MQLSGMPLRDQDPNKFHASHMKMKSCSKFQKTKTNQDVNSSRAIIFNQLRNNGCDKETALTFCTKNICKFDSTKQVDGPSNYRILNVKYEKDKAVNGWYQSQPNYLMQRNYHLSVQDFLNKQDQDTQKFENEFENKQNNTQKEYKDKISNIHQYYKDLNNKYSLKSINLDELKEKIKQFRQELTQSQKQSYVIHENMKLYGLGEQINRIKNNKNNLIEQAQVFNHIGTDLNKIMQDKQFHYVDTKQEDDILHQKMIKEYERIDNQQRDQMKQLKTGKKLDDIKKKNMNLKFANLLVKSQMLGNLVKLEDYSDDQKASLICKQLRKRHQQTQKKDNEQINQLIKDKQQAQALGKEFNSSKYVTQKKKKIQSVDLCGNKLVENQVQIFIQDYIKNLNNNDDKEIDQSQLNEIIQMRSNFKSSLSTRIEALPELYIKKSSSYLNIKDFIRQETTLKKMRNARTNSQYGKFNRPQGDIKFNTAIGFNLKKKESTPRQSQTKNTTMNFESIQIQTPKND